MGKNATNVRVALTGSIWFNPSLAAVIPSNLTDDPTALGYIDLGYTTEDGVTFTLSKETEDLMGWQTADVLRKLVTSEPKAAAFTLRQLDQDTWLATNGGTITEITSGLYRWEPTEGQIVEGILLVDFRDGTKDYRFGFRRASQSGEVEFSMVRSDAVNLPNEWTALVPQSGKAFFMDTNDPAFAPSAAAADPIITSISPAGQAIGEHVYIQGGNFTGLTGITVDTKAVASPVVVTDQLIDAVIPAAVTTAAPVNVVVTTASGSVTAQYTVSAT